MSRFQTLGLVFEEHSGSPLKSPPTHARIYLQTFATTSAHRFPEPIHALTPVEYSADAFDAHADRLIKNIERLKKEARVKFDRTRSHPGV